MTRAEIEGLIGDALQSVAPESDPSTVAKDADLRDELDLDSMDFTNFVIFLHERLGIDIPEVDYPKYCTIDGAVAELLARLEGS